MANIENAEFKTIDGITLKGLIYAAGARGPGVILAPGVSQLHSQDYPVPERLISFS